MSRVARMGGIGNEAMLASLFGIANTAIIDRVESDKSIPEGMWGFERGREERTAEAIKFEDFMWMCVEDQTPAQFQLQDIDCYIEIIGNTCENPELLKDLA